jgi:hypothetical protein
MGTLRIKSIKNGMIFKNNIINKMDKMGCVSMGRSLLEF